MGTQIQLDLIESKEKNVEDDNKHHESDIINHSNASAQSILLSNQLLNNLLYPLAQPMLYDIEHLNRRQAAAIIYHITDESVDIQNMIKLFIKKLKEEDFVKYLEIQMVALKSSFHDHVIKYFNQLENNVITDSDEMIEYENQALEGIEAVANLSKRLIQSMGIMKLQGIQLNALLNFFRAGIDYSLSSKHTLRFFEILIGYVRFLSPSYCNQLTELIDEKISNADKDIIELIESKDDISEIMTEFRDVLSGKSKTRVQKRVVTKDGSTRTISKRVRKTLSPATKELAATTLTRVAWRQAVLEDEYDELSQLEEVNVEKVPLDESRKRGRSTTDDDQVLPTSRARRYEIRAQGNANNRKVGKESFSTRESDEEQEEPEDEEDEDEFPNKKKSNKKQRTLARRSKKEVSPEPRNTRPLRSVRGRVARTETFVEQADEEKERAEELKQDDKEQDMSDSSASEGEGARQGPVLGLHLEDLLDEDDAMATDADASRSQGVDSEKSRQSSRGSVHYGKRSNSNKRGDEEGVDSMQEENTEESIDLNTLRQQEEDLFAVLDNRPSRKRIR